MSDKRCTTTAKVPIPRQGIIEEYTQQFGQWADRRPCNPQPAAGRPQRPLPLDLGRGGGLDRCDTGGRAGVGRWAGRSWPPARLFFIPLSVPSPSASVASIAQPPLPTQVDNSFFFLQVEGQLQCCVLRVSVYISVSISSDPAERTHACCPRRR